MTRFRSWLRQSEDTVIPAPARRVRRSGIPTPASCREAHKRRFILNQWILRFANAPLRMTIPSLALIFTLITITESRANDTATQNEETSKILPDSGSCGNGCLYQITTDATTGKQSLRVYNAPNYTGVANIANYAFAGTGNAANGKYQEYYANANFDKITIDGDFDAIGRHAFWRNGASEVVFNGNIKTIDYEAFEFNNLTSVNLPEGLQKIGGEAFHVNSISSIVIPDSVTSIGSYAFGGLKSGGEVYISDSLNNLGTYYPFGKNFSMICKGDEAKCQSLVKEYHLDNSSTTTDLSDRVTGVDKDHCTGEKYFWNGNSCSRKESYCDKDMYYSGYECKMRPTDGTEITCDYDISGYVKVGNNCYSPEVTYAKKHYTPAEANEWLHDGNDNFVVITFKK